MTNFDLLGYGCAQRQKEIMTFVIMCEEAKWFLIIRMCVVLVLLVVLTQFTKVYKVDENFLLQLLLVNVHEPISLESLRTVKDVLCSTFCTAYQQPNLLKNNKHWDMTNRWSNCFCMSKSDTIILCDHYLEIVHKFKDEISDEILYRIDIRSENPNLKVNEEVKN